VFCKLAFSPLFIGADPSADAKRALPISEDRLFISIDRQLIPLDQSGAKAIRASTTSSFDAPRRAGSSWIQH